jgi:hypothetical protein
VVGGVAVTAGGVIAGSSLTAFGALAPSNARFLIAILGGVLGFYALAMMLTDTLNFIKMKRITLQDLIGERTIQDSRQQIENNLFGVGSPKTLQNFVDEAEQNYKQWQIMPNEKERKVAADRYNHMAKELNIIYNDLGGQFMLRAFDGLWRKIRFATIFVILGFGTFAWAANPPAAESVVVSMSDLKALMEAARADIKAARADGLTKGSAIEMAVQSVDARLNQMNSRIEAGTLLLQQALEGVQAALRSLEAMRANLEHVAEDVRMLLALLQDHNTLAISTLTQIEAEMNDLKRALSRREVEMTKSSDQLAREQRWQ